MSHTYVQNIVHIIFSTKNRAASIPAALLQQLCAYIHGICRNQRIFCHAAGCASDHLHLLIQIPADVPLAKTVNVIKSNSSRWMTQQGSKFAWQENYAAFSVSASLAPAVIRYIDKQETHHRRMDFPAELLALLKRHGVAYDPKHVLT
jgi:REP element-mobilizing transposase RayT